MKLLTVNNLSAGYNGTNIIRNISFSVDSGQIIGILGANGCGKTVSYTHLTLPTKLEV